MAAAEDDRRTTDSGIEIKPIVPPDDLEGWDYATPAGRARAVPLHPRRVPEHVPGPAVDDAPVRGFGTAEATNERWKLLAASGSTGLSLRLRPAHPDGLRLRPRPRRGRGGQGRRRHRHASPTCGCSSPTCRSTRSRTSMTINATSSILLLLYQLVAEEQGVDPKKLNGTIQNDILKEYVARGTYIYPPRPSMRIITDIFGYCRSNLPSWNTISISGYHIREAGSTAVQEIAFTLANGIAYVGRGHRSGPRRRRVRPPPAASSGTPTTTSSRRSPSSGRRRRMWARIMTDRFAAKSEKSKLAALPHPDRRQHAHGPAAREQLDAGDDPGAGRRARRHPEPAHQRLRRGPRPADAEGGQPRPAHPAGASPASPA